METNGQTALMENQNPLFELGIIRVINQAVCALGLDDLNAALCRHERGDWGNVEPEFAERNASAVTNGGRIFSIYEDESGGEFWVLTREDRSETLVMFSYDYN